MIVKKINSHRNYGHPSLQIVKEWEDVFANSLNAEIICERRLFRNPISEVLPKFYALKTRNALTFEFLMKASEEYRYKNFANYLPCVIDFFLDTEDELRLFEKRHNNNKIVFISSKEAYDYLKEHECRLNIEHLPLSLPNKYSIDPTTKYNKEYDFVLVGRQNPILRDWLEVYEKKHGDLCYVSEGEIKYTYYTNRGEFVGSVKSREDYISLIRKSRIAIYSTPSMDASRETAKGFNQVTPKFLEYIASGCHIIARYPHNSDTDFYELDTFAINCQSYDEFERCVDNARITNVDMNIYSKYLSKHYTSNRVKDLVSCINKHFVQ